MPAQNDLPVSKGAVRRPVPLTGEDWTTAFGTFPEAGPLPHLGSAPLQQLAFTPAQVTPLPLRPAYAEPLVSFTVQRP
jgi:hypothetical protein